MSSDVQKDLENKAKEEGVKVKALKHPKSKMIEGKVYTVSKSDAKVLIDKKMAKSAE